MVSDVVIMWWISVNNVMMVILPTEMAVVIVVRSKITGYVMVVQVVVRVQICR